MPHTQIRKTNVFQYLLRPLDAADLTDYALPASLACGEPSTADGMNDAGDPVNNSATGPHHPPMIFGVLPPQCAGIPKKDPHGNFQPRFDGI